MNKLDISGIDKYPPNWNKFKETIEDMEKRIRRGKANQIQQSLRSPSQCLRN